jgi:hypothetical protein
MTFFKITPRPSFVSIARPLVARLARRGVLGKHGDLSQKSLSIRTVMRWVIGCVLLFNPHGTASATLLPPLKDWDAQKVHFAAGKEASRFELSSNYEIGRMVSPLVSV